VVDRDVRLKLVWSASLFGSRTSA